MKLVILCFADQCPYELVHVDLLFVLFSVVDKACHGNENDLVILSHLYMIIWLFLYSATYWVFVVVFCTCLKVVGPCNDGPSGQLVFWPTVSKGPFSTLQPRLGPCVARLGLGTSRCMYICDLNQTCFRSLVSSLLPTHHLSAMLPDHSCAF